jgi:hypothetical protein
LEVVWWLSPVLPQPLCPIRFENLHKCRAQELSPSAFSVIKHSDVMEIAFIFSAEILEELWVDFAGITHVYFTRQQNHHAFSTLVPESYPNRIWYSILGLQEKFRKLLSYKRQQQLCQRSVSGTLSLECWHYIIRRLKEHVVPVDFKKTLTKVQHFSDLSMLSKSKIRNYSIIWIISQSSMNAARKVFGNTFGLGSRNNPPRKGAPRKVLEVGNKVNLVDVPTTFNQEEFVEKVPAERIELVYEELTRSKSLRVKYSGVLAQNPKIGEILHFSQPLSRSEESKQPPIRPLRRVRAIPLGTSFVYNGKLFSVTASDGKIVYAICTADREALNLTNDEVWQVIRNNIG